MFSKVAILCSILVAVNATALLHGAALAHTGSSVTSRHQDAHGNYAFNYGIANGHGATNSRSEVGDGHGNKKGSYTLHDIDGRARRVDYVADALGFRAVVNTNEPGTAHSAPAASLTNSPYAAPVAPVAHAPVALAHSAPLAYAHSAPLAVAHAAPLAYSAHHIAAAPIAHAPLLAGHGLLGAGHLSYAVGGIGHHGIRSYHY